MLHAKRASITAIAILIASVTIGGSQNADLDGFKKEAVAWVDANKDTLNSIARRIWEYAETALLEHKSDPKIIEKAQAEFTEKTKGFTYKSAVPRDQKPRLPQPPAR